MRRRGKGGTRCAVRGEKSPPNKECEVIWGAVSGGWKVTEAEYKGREFIPADYLMGKVKSDAQGRFTASFTTPDDFGFEHDIVAQQGTGLLTQVAYNVDMTVDISPKSGPVGTPITFTVKGIGWRSLYNSWELLYDNNFTGWMSAVTTRGEASFTIPATGNVGDHILQVTHGALTFPYQNPGQNPAQGRPRFSFMFKVTPRAAILPVAPEQQAQTRVRRLPPPGEPLSAPHFSAVRDPVNGRAGGLHPV